MLICLIYIKLRVVFKSIIGTTVTAQIVSFNLSQYIPMMPVGFFLTNKSRIAGSSLIGLGGLFFGLI